MKPLSSPDATCCPDYILGKWHVLHGRKLLKSKVYTVVTTFGETKRTFVTAQTADGVRLVNLTTGTYFCPITGKSASSTVYIKELR